VAIILFYFPNERGNITSKFKKLLKENNKNIWL
jgi:hypothetical protein